MNNVRKAKTLLKAAIELLKEEVNSSITATRFIPGSCYVHKYIDDYAFCFLRNVNENKAKILPFEAKSVKDTEIFYFNDEDVNNFKQLSILDVHRISKENNHDWFLKWFSR